MSRMTTLLTFCLLMIAPVAFPQQSAPQTPEDAYTSRELIAWSQLQTPQPTPQPLPPRGAPVPQPEQPQDQQAKLPADPKNQQEPAQSYVGEIIKSGNQYVLQTGDNTKYQLNANGILGVYANQNVKVVGNIDPNAKSIWVLRVEPFL